MSEGALEPGVIVGKYRILRRLGEGGMAEVWEAEHVRLRHRVAVKVLLGDLAKNPVMVARFEREAHALAKLRSPNVVRVVDVDALPNGAPYFVMEHLEGHDLAAEIARRGALPIGEAVSIVLQAANAMIEAHAAGLVHRDLKPSNLFLTEVSGKRVVRVLDFGIALEEGELSRRLTRTEVVMGTPFYMAPEQFQSARQADARSDVWALGATLYEALAGQPPFVGTATTIGVAVVTEPLRPVRLLRPEASKGLTEIVEKALEKDPADRWPTMEAFADALIPHADVAVASAPTLAVSTGPMLPASDTAVVRTQDDAPAATETKAPRRSWLFAVPIAVAVLAGGVVAGTRGKVKADAKENADAKAEARADAKVDAGATDAPKSDAVAAVTASAPRPAGVAAAPRPSARPRPAPSTTPAKPQASSAPPLFF